jgi:hypothetical protein
MMCCCCCPSTNTPRYGVVVDEFASGLTDCLSVDKFASGLTDCLSVDKFAIGLTNNCLSVDEFASGLTNCLSVDEFASGAGKESALSDRKRLLLLKSKMEERIASYRKLLHPRKA